MVRAADEKVSQCNTTVLLAPIFFFFFDEGIVVVIARAHTGTMLIQMRLRKSLCKKGN